VGKVDFSFFFISSFLFLHLLDNVTCPRDGLLLLPGG